MYWCRSRQRAVHLLRGLCPVTYSARLCKLLHLLPGLCKPYSSHSLPSQPALLNSSRQSKALMLYPVLILAQMVRGIIHEQSTTEACINFTRQICVRASGYPSFWNLCPLPNDPQWMVERAWIPMMALLQMTSASLKTK